MAIPLLHSFFRNDDCVKNWPWPLLTPKESLGIDGANGASYQLHNTDLRVQHAGDTWPCVVSVAA